MSIIDQAKKILKEDVLEIENRTDLTEDQKVEKIIKVFSITCSAIAIQPIPFADIFVLTPIQAFMGSKIAAIRGLNIKEQKAYEIVKEISVVIGLGLLGQQLAIGAYKTFIPFLGAITTIPMVYGLTYGIGKVMDAYVKAKLKGQTLTKSNMKNIFDQARKEGKKEGKKNKEKVQQKGKQF